MEWCSCLLNARHSGSLGKEPQILAECASAWWTYSLWVFMCRVKTSLASSMVGLFAGRGSRQRMEESTVASRCAWAGASLASLHKKGDRCVQKVPSANHSAKLLNCCSLMGGPVVLLYLFRTKQAYSNVVCRREDVSLRHFRSRIPHPVLERLGKVVGYCCPFGYLKIDVMSKEQLGVNSYS